MLVAEEAEAIGGNPLEYKKVGVPARAAAAEGQCTRIAWLPVYTAAFCSS
jgi:hypothetical protein